MTDDLSRAWIRPLVKEQFNALKQTVVEAVASKLCEQLGRYLEGSNKLAHFGLAAIEKEVVSFLQDRETHPFQQCALTHSPPPSASTRSDTKAESSPWSAPVKPVTSHGSPNHALQSDTDSSAPEIVQQRSDSAGSDKYKRPTSTSNKIPKRTPFPKIAVEVKNSWTDVSYRKGTTQQNWVNKPALYRLKAGFQHDPDSPYSEDLWRSQVTSCGTAVFPISHKGVDGGALGEPAAIFQVAKEYFDGDLIIGRSLADQLKLGNDRTDKQSRLQGKQFMFCLG